MTELALFGTDLFGEVVRPKASGPVAERFTLPPFTLLDARAGEWQERKRAWAALGIRGEEGRSAKAYNIHGWMEDRPEARGELGLEGLKGDGTSIFDPVMVELAYRWFSPAGGQVVDPFAGGSVRGIVAGCLGRHYWGCDLRPEQIAANQVQAEDIAPTVRPVWVCGDSMDTLTDAPAADFVFSCPPYGDLEKYSDDPRARGSEFHTGKTGAHQMGRASSAPRQSKAQRQRRKQNSTNDSAVPGAGPHNGLHRAGSEREPALRNRRSVWTVPTQPYTGAHFATFPPALIEPCILAGSRPGDLVLDPFMGSGTTAQVAQALGRQWIGCELQSDYAHLVEQRTAQSALAL